MQSIKKIIKKHWWIILVLIAVLFVGYLSLMWFYSKRTKPISFNKQKIQNTKNYQIPGVLFVDSIINLVETELNSRAGWTPNDIFPSPTYFLDNKVNEQLGILEVVQRTLYQLNENITRTKSTDRILKSIEIAKNAFYFSPNRLIFPSTESKYQQGIESLKRYKEQLINGKEVFYIRADNLIDLFRDYRSKLGGITNKLRSAISSKKYVVVENSNQVSKIENIDFPFTKIDDLFYEAEGFGCALYTMLQAINHDYAPVIKDKDTQVLMNEILFLMEDVYFEPLIVLNGDRDNLIISNHLANLNIVLLDLQLKFTSLIEMLENN